MFRKDLIPILQRSPLSVIQIARWAEQSPRDVEEDLRHLFQSLKHSDLVAEVEPSTCRKCGFVFGPDKLRKPSKCPECKSTWLSEPLIRIRDNDKHP